MAVSLYCIMIFIYFNIIKDQNIMMKDRILIVTYSFCASFIACFGMVIIENLFPDFWFYLYNSNIPLYFITIVLIEEVLKLALIPFITKNILVIDKIAISTCLSFALFENIVIFARNPDLSTLIFRLLAITPIHMFIGFVYYYLFYLIYENKLNKKFIYGIPFATFCIHLFTNFAIIGATRGFVYIYSICTMIFSIRIAKKYMFKKNKKSSLL